MSVNQRIKFLVDKLSDGNVSRFAKEIGVSHTSINTLMPGERESKPGFETIAKISTRFPEVNIDWLIKEKGEPLKNDRKAEGESNIQIFTNGTEKHHELQAIPVYDIIASAGLANTYDSSSHILNYMSLPSLPRCDGSVYLRGDSMYPLIKDGSLVAYQRVLRIPQEVSFGEIYVVDLSTPYLERIYVKYVQRSALGPEYFKLVSYNKNHEPEDVLVSEIRAMARVKASVQMF